MVLTKLKFDKEKEKVSQNIIILYRNILFDLKVWPFGIYLKYLAIKLIDRRTSDTRLNWSISWCNWEIFSALEIDASCKEVRHSRSSRNSLSTPFALASLSAASAPKIFTLSTAPDFTSSISLHLIKSNSWHSKHRAALRTRCKDNFRENLRTREGWWFVKN